MIDACLLGTGGMMPLPWRWLSALLLRSNGNIILCDCGEGTQITWKETGWGFRNGGTIVLSHLHADHVAGLPGVLFMIAFAGRTEPLSIYGTVGTRETVAALRVIVPKLPYPVTVHDLTGDEEIPLPGGMIMRTLPVDHRIPTLAYTFYQPRAPRFAVERARELGIPVTLWSRLQRGEVVQVGGCEIGPEAVLGPSRRGLTVAYVTDTRPTPELPGFVRGANLLVCEGMYGNPEDLPKAIERGHMTFQESAEIAAEAGARRLWLTHFSPSLTDPEYYLPLARAIFPATEIGVPHWTLTLSFTDS